MKPVVISTCFCFISLVALCSQIILTSEYKVAYALCLILLVLHLYKLVQFSDDLETANNKVQSMLYFDSKWYAKSREVQRLTAHMILRCQKSEHYSFHAGFVTFDRPLLLSLVKKTYSFINFLIFVNNH
uniref:Uncharacterized protein n=1 Tax=Cacopsylla melanoneura TaxID=428564 RepID=A0A8D8RVS9_9HEMI